jgi:hypothetical protein
MKGGCVEAFYGKHMDINRGKIAQQPKEPVLIPYQIPMCLTHPQKTS